MTAQDAYSALMRDHIGPLLRERHFKGSGSAWRLPSETHWVLVGWQKDRYSSAESVRFTCNLKVIDKAEWDAENTPEGRVPDKPSPSLDYGVGWEQRLGSLTPGSGGDRWWYVRPGDDLPAIAEEVVATLDRHGLPAMQALVAAALAERPTCSHNVGYRNSHQACGRPAELALAGKERRYFRCQEHGEEMARTSQHPVIGRWPSLV